MLNIIIIMSWEVKVHDKGLIVLPAELRRALHIRRGSILEVRREGDRIVLKPKPTLLESYGSDEKVRATRVITRIHEERRREVEAESAS
jgi:AbrB family looped-hinge helix DNA binding protein